ncbi:Terminase small subunit [Dehalogenimonas alkenigignens]|uniref:Terminase small subunit n=1 Tax=Dehalogenimonas alkenigignens TaxID=1217799 RepID=A0A0W0GJD4_9CHLR|nr:terminase small subunit [Dehalogenimonas alkenigignens]KTB48666.1 Terminase small subunit [Dehalogenimonas alkenigignens]
MPPLNKTKWELFCQQLMLGKSQAESARLAGYSPRSAYTTCSVLLRNPKIQARLKELKEQSSDTTIASVRERKEILTEIIRTEWSDNRRVTPMPNIAAIDLLNKMDNLYRSDPVVSNNRTYNIIVHDAKTKGLVQRIIEGKARMLEQDSENHDTNESDYRIVPIV